MSKKVSTFILLTIFAAFIFISFKNIGSRDPYLSDYNQKLNYFKNDQLTLIGYVHESNIASPKDLEKIRQQIFKTRNSLKAMDLWMRYLEPLPYKKINGPLPVEWETEVFEKFEKPYRREGAGLTLAAIYVDEPIVIKDTLLKLIKLSIEATQVFNADSITEKLKTHHHFYLCNRLFLLNLAAIYTTGFECPDTTKVIPELRNMLASVDETYQFFNESFPATPLTQVYLSLYKKTIQFTHSQPVNYTQFDHFTFIKNYINPLFALNQKMINQYKVSSRSNVDYALNKNNTSIFSKTLYQGQNPKGIFLRVKDEEVLSEIDRVGKLLFYDPILSGNNQRSCVSCHKSTQHFTDRDLKTSLQYDRQSFLPRNTPSLINVGYNHLIMMDGKHISLQHQTKAVITNPVELGSSEQEVLQKILSCNEYNKVFTKLLKYTPQETEITFEHIVSAITFYYSKFSDYYAPFDEAVNENKPLETSARLGFNVFMGKAQCATCHFAPHFNGVKPSYVGSEFEVLGVPADTNYTKLSLDKGRHGVNPADETLSAFRTGSLRNIEHTAPYMHNGVFSTLSQVIDFYDGGGGAGRGLKVDNQTLSSDSLHLTKMDKYYLIQFMKSLNENIKFENAPVRLPASSIQALNKRKVGGEY